MYSQEKIIELAEQALEELEEYTEDGLPKVYECVQEYMYDFYPNLPWDTEPRNVAIDHMLRPEAWAILHAFTERFDFDIEAELKGTRTDKILN